MGVPNAIFCLLVASSGVIIISTTHNISVLSKRLTPLLAVLISAECAGAWNSRIAFVIPVPVLLCCICRFDTFLCRFDRS